MSRPEHPGVWRFRAVTAAASLALILAVISISHWARPLPSADGSERETLLGVQQQVIAIGIQWTDGQGLRYRWAGTGFLVGKAGWGATAGHVLQEMVSESNDLEHRGLRPMIVGDFPDGSVRELVNVSLYPGLPLVPNSVPGKFDIDLGRFQAIPAWNKPGLEVAYLQAAYAGETIIIPGFPTASTEVAYPTGPASPGRIVPTVRIGHLERLTGLDTLPADNPTLLQHDIALVGGYSGSPVVDRDGRVLGIVTVSQHIQMNNPAASVPFSGASNRVVDAGGFNFAIAASYFTRWIRESAR